MLSVLSYLIHIDPWMALAAFGLFVPQLLFVPLLQAGVNRRTGARIRVLRQLGIAMIKGSGGAECRGHAPAISPIQLSGRIPSHAAPETPGSINEGGRTRLFAVPRLWRGAR